MAKPESTKVSRKDLAKLNTRETMLLAKQTYGKLLGYVKPYRVRFILGMVFGVLSGLSNALLVQSIKVVSNVVLGGQHTISAWDKIKELTLGVHVDLMAQAVVEQHVDKVKDFKLGVGVLSLNPAEWMPESWRSSEGLIIAGCALVPLVFLLRGGLTYIANYLMMWVSNRILYDLRNDCYSAILAQSVGYFAKAKTGNLVQTVFNQARVAQQNLMTLSQDVVQRPVSIIAILATLLHANWQFTMYSLIVFPLCMFPVVAIGRRVRKAGAQEEQEAGQMMVQMTECFTGIRVVKSHAREEFEEKKFRDSSSKMNKLIMRYGKALELVGMLVESVASFGVAIGLYYAAKHGMRTGDFMLLVGGLTQIYPHAKALSRLQLVTQKTMVATSNIFAQMETVPEVQDKAAAVPLPRVSGHITFDHVNFAYKTKDVNQKRALVDVSLEFEPGKFYALVGPSGAGKTTLFALIQRFYDVDSGSIRFSQHDIRDVTQKSLRDNIGVVSQDTFLFHDTIAENIRYGRLNAKREEVIEAATKAHVHEFVSQDKEGYEKIVGDAGVTLSGGQKQRVSIARAILRNAPILLLDEATSALDPETERNIKDAVHTLTEGKTVIAIAHRLGTVMEADQIIVMEKGSVIAKGTHQELLASCELYQRLHALSFQE